MNFGSCIQMYNHYRHRSMEQFPHPKKLPYNPLRLIPPHLPSPLLPWAASHLPSVTTVLSFQECVTIGMISV